MSFARYATTILSTPSPSAHAELGEQGGDTVGAGSTSTSTYHSTFCSSTHHLSHPELNVPIHSALNSDSPDQQSSNDNLDFHPSPTELSPVQFANSRLWESTTLLPRVFETVVKSWTRTPNRVPLVVESYSLTSSIDETYNDSIDPPQSLLVEIERREISLHHQSEEQEGMETPLLAEEEGYRIGITKGRGVGGNFELRKFKDSSWIGAFLFHGLLVFSIAIKEGWNHHDHSNPVRLPLGSKLKLRKLTLQFSRNWFPSYPSYLPFPFSPFSHS